MDIPRTYPIPPAPMKASPVCAELEPEDPLLPEAFAALRETRKASVAVIQRRLCIGYNTALVLMNQLQRRGIVGPENCSSPREILVDLDTYEFNP